ncbi:MAG: hypothetical protein Pg6C_09120 [Treponemataceae bacterium]|nr:MAG: hypothetical protein Pg6C_09120 [Treponemataceae bacterium]
MYAFGKKDTELRQIDAYIAEHDYNAALAMINTYLAERPENFDAVQKRIEQIIAARNDFAAAADELIDVMLNDPDNNEKKLALITKLENMEKNPSESSVSFMIETKRAAQFTYYRVLFAEFMRRGSDAVKAGNYNEGMRNFYAGLDLYQADFFQAGYSDEVTVPVKQSLDALSDAPRGVQAMLPRVDHAVQSFNAAVVSRDYAAIREAYARARTVFGEYAQLRNRIQAQGLVFKSDFSESSGVKPDLTQTPFLLFAQRFVLGQSQNAYSGMIGALDVNFERAVNSMRDAIVSEEQKIGQEIFGYLGANPAQGLEANRNAFDNRMDAVLRLADTALDVNALYLPLNEENAPPGTRQPLYPNFIRSVTELKTLADAIASMQADARAVRSSRQALLELTVPADTAEAFRSGSPDFAPTLVAEAQNMLAVSRRSEANAGMFAGAAPDERAAGYGRDAEEPLQIDEDPRLSWDIFTQTGSALAAGLKSDSDAAAAAAWRRLALFYSGASNKIVDGLVQRMQTAHELLSPAADGAAYPAEAEAEARGLLTILRSDRERMREAAAMLGPNAVMGDQVSVSEAEIRAGIARLDAVEADAVSLIPRAQEQSALAQRALNEAELRYNMAMQAFAAKDFDSARGNLQISRTRFNESLALQDSPALRTDSDTRLAALGARIAAEENEIIVREVRELKTRAREAYYNGSFETAENLLNRAQSRWKLVSMEDDAEVRTLLALVGTAISMKTGRAIPVTAPLYPEMSQTLNISRQYYNQGAILIRQGNRTEAVEILNTAKQKLRELQLVYPFNQEASLLTLRIEQLTDPRAFETQFANRVAAARNDYRGAETRRRAYADLLDLYEINPAYPGLRSLITQVEIEIGIRARPVDQTALDNSRALTSQARNLIASGTQNEIALRQALSLTDQAIGLNPNNNEAIILKDRILSMLGSRQVTVLSGADENAYQRAVQELQRGNAIEAKAIVEQLLRSEVNRRSFKVLELQKKVDSLL